MIIRGRGTPPLQSGGAGLPPPGRDDTAGMRPQYPRGVERGGGRRRAREETEEEYSATGKGAKDSKRDTGERQQHRTSNTPPGRRAQEAFYRAYPDCPQGTQVHLLPCEPGRQEPPHPVLGPTRLDWSKGPAIAKG